MKKLFCNNSKTYFFSGFILLLVSIMLQTEYRIYSYIENIFFNKTTQQWLIQDPKNYFVFTYYTLPKIVLILMTFMTAFLNFNSGQQYNIRRTCAFLFCMTFIPSVVSLLKHTSHIHCPYDLVDYGGTTPFRSLLDWNTYSSFYLQYGNGNCFPGGHASGGYAFMSSYFVLPEKYKKIGIAIGLLMGTYMGAYQLLRGAHFMSHILFTLGFSIIVITGLSWILIPKKRLSLD